MLLSAIKSGNFCQTVQCVDPICTEQLQSALSLMYDYQPNQEAKEKPLDQNALILYLCKNIMLHTKSNRDKILHSKNVLGLRPIDIAINHNKALAIFLLLMSEKEEIAKFDFSSLPSDGLNQESSDILKFFEKNKKNIARIPILLLKPLVVVASMRAKDKLDDEFCQLCQLKTLKIIENFSTLQYLQQDYIDLYIKTATAHLYNVMGFLCYVQGKYAVADIYYQQGIREGWLAEFFEGNVYNPKTVTYYHQQNTGKLSYYQMLPVDKDPIFNLHKMHSVVYDEELTRKSILGFVEQYDQGIKAYPQRREYFLHQQLKLLMKLYQFKKVIAISEREIKEEKSDDFKKNWIFYFWQARALEYLGQLDTSLLMYSKIIAHCQEERQLAKCLNAWNRGLLINHKNYTEDEQLLPDKLWDFFGYFRKAFYDNIEQQKPSSMTNFLQSIERQLVNISLAYLDNDEDLFFEWAKITQRQEKLSIDEFVERVAKDCSNEVKLATVLFCIVHLYEDAYLLVSDDSWNTLAVWMANVIISNLYHCNTSIEMLKKTDIFFQIALEGLLEPKEFNNNIVSPKLTWRYGINVGRPNCRGLLQHCGIKVNDFYFCQKETKIEKYGWINFPGALVIEDTLESLDYAGFIDAKNAEIAVRLKRLV